MKTYYVLEFTGRGFCAVETSNERGWDDLNDCLNAGAKMAKADELAAMGEEIDFLENALAIAEGRGASWATKIQALIDEIEAAMGAQHDADMDSL